MTTVEELLVDGELLNTYAYNLTTWSGRSGTPPIVGENRQVVGRPGSSWQRKDFGERIEMWSMWVLGCDEDGLFPVEHSRRAQFNANLDALKRLFGVRHRELALTRKLLMPSGLVTHTASGEVVNALDPQTMAGATRATFSVEMRLADPFWYGEVVNATVDSTGAEVTNPGTTMAQKMQLVFTGPLTFPRLVNTDIGVEVRLNRSLTGGQTVTLDTDLFTAVTNTSDNAIADVLQFGSDWWMELLPGANSMALNNWTGGAVGSGSVAVSFLPPYL